MKNAKENKGITLVAFNNNSNSIINLGGSDNKLSNRRKWGNKQKQGNSKDNI